MTLKPPPQGGRRVRTERRRSSCALCTAVLAVKAASIAAGPSVACRDPATVLAVPRGCGGEFQRGMVGRPRGGPGGQAAQGDRLGVLDTGGRRAAHRLHLFRSELPVFAQALPGHTGGGRQRRIAVAVDSGGATRSQQPGQGCGHSRRARSAQSFPQKRGRLELRRQPGRRHPPPGPPQRPGAASASDQRRAHASGQFAHLSGHALSHRQRPRPPDRRPAAGRCHRDRAAQRQLTRGPELLHAREDVLELLRIRRADDEHGVALFVAVEQGGHARRFGGFEQGVVGVEHGACGGQYLAGRGDAAALPCRPFAVGVLVFVKRFETVWRLKNGGAFGHAGRGEHSDGHPANLQSVLAHFRAQVGVELVTVGAIGVEKDVDHARPTAFGDDRGLAHLAEHFDGVGVLGLLGAGKRRQTHDAGRDDGGKGGAQRSAAIENHAESPRLVGCLSAQYAANTARAQKT